jgi:hypothetical protein
MAPDFPACWGISTDVAMSVLRERGWRRGSERGRTTTATSGSLASQAEEVSRSISRMSAAVLKGGCNLNLRQCIVAHGRGRLWLHARILNAPTEDTRCHNHPGPAPGARQRVGYWDYGLPPPVSCAAYAADREPVQGELTWRLGGGGGREDVSPASNWSAPMLHCAPRVVPHMSVVKS